MTEPVRPKIVTASVMNGDLTLFGDGVPLIRMPVRAGMWLLTRIADALVKARP